MGRQLQVPGRMHSGTNKPVVAAPIIGGSGASGDCRRTYAPAHYLSRPGTVGLNRLDIVRLRSLRTLDGLEFNGLSLTEGSEPLHADGCMVNEEVTAPVVGGDKSIALRIVEPLDRA